MFFHQKRKPRDQKQTVNSPASEEEKEWQRRIHTEKVVKLPVDEYGAKPVDDCTFRKNTAASFDDIVENGPAVDPLEFDPATIGQAERVDAPVYFPATQDIMEVSNIIYERHADGSPPKRAYWVQRKLQKCIFGAVRSCTVLKFRNDLDVPWEVTSQKAAVKIMGWKKIESIPHVEDPLKEVAAMQHVGLHPHVMGTLDVLQDEDYLLLFMPFCTSGDLFGFVEEAGRFPEPMARFWFRQILDGLCHLQRKGVCHRDMSLENILVDEYKTSVVIDLGMCLRVPFADDSGNITDVANGRLRRLLKPIVPCGKPNYMSPEVLYSEEPFDGFAIDLFACGVILFMMLVGLPPWELPREEDPRFRMVSQGRLADLLGMWRRPLSPLAVDLIQKMLMKNPRHRLSLDEVKSHPWMTEEDESAEPIKPPPHEGWRNA